MIINIEKLLSSRGRILAITLMLVLIITVGPTNITNIIHAQDIAGNTKTQPQTSSCHSWPEFPGKCMPVKHPEPPCVIYVHTQPMMDEKGNVVSGKDVTSWYDIVCPALEAPATGTNSSSPDAVASSDSVYLGCYWGQQPWVTGTMWQGTATRTFDYNWYDDNGRLRDGAAQGYLLCGYSTCQWSSSVPGDSNRRYVEFSIVHPTFVEIQNNSCL